MRRASSGGVLPPMCIAPRQMRLTVSGPSLVVSMPLACPLMRICVYAGSNPGADPAYGEAAAELARLLAQRGIGVVYGGAQVGLMGILADTALAAGGEVIGVMPQALIDREIGHTGLSEQHIVG